MLCLLLCSPAFARLPGLDQAALQPGCRHGSRNLSATRQVNQRREHYHIRRKLADTQVQRGKSSSLPAMTLGFSLMPRRFPLPCDKKASTVPPLLGGTYLVLMALLDLDPVYEMPLPSVLDDTDTDQLLVKLRFVHGEPRFDIAPELIAARRDKVIVTAAPDLIPPSLINQLKAAEGW
jgi:hypothetical protein